MRIFGILLTNIFTFRLFLTFWTLQSGRRRFETCNLILILADAVAGRVKCGRRVDTFTRFVQIVVPLIRTTFDTLNRIKLWWLQMNQLINCGHQDMTINITSLRMVDLMASNHSLQVKEQSSWSRICCPTLFVTRNTFFLDDFSGDQSTSAPANSITTSGFGDDYSCPYRCLECVSASRKRWRLTQR